MAYCNQLFSAQMKTRAVRTELLTGKPRSTDVNKIWRISIDHGLCVPFPFRNLEISDRTSNHVAWRAKFLARFVWNPFSWNTVGEFVAQTSPYVNIFWLRMNYNVGSLVQSSWKYGNDKNNVNTNSPAPFARSASRNTSPWVRIAN